MAPGGRANFSISPPAVVILLLLYAQGCIAHEHHTDEVPEGESISAKPLDSILWTHILLQILAFGLVFPTGMVLGIVRSPWHVPVQTAGTVISIVAWFLGHAHKGRQFAPNIHASFASSLMLLLLLQVVIGIYLKLHLVKGFHSKIRTTVVRVHGTIGKIMPAVSWVQMLFGGITALGFCREDHLGQCLAHFIMGSAFIGYGIIMTILLLVGQIWLRRSGRSQEFFDSLLITVWGVVNTFTEHRWGQPWRHNDIQHTSMGIIWWCAGLLGIWLSRSRGGRPKRNVVPAMVLLLTGWAMSAHPQALKLSAMVHSVFGYTLMAAGATRLVEIAFVLKDRRGLVGEPNSFQYLPPFLLYASGFLFMGATEEQMQLLSDTHITHASYILILYSVAFLLFLFVNVLLHMYAVHAWPTSTTNGRRESRIISRSVHARSQQRRVVAHPSAADLKLHDADADVAVMAKSGIGMNGLAPSSSSHHHPRPHLHQSPLGIPKSRQHPQIDNRDADTFELEGLIGHTDGEDDYDDDDGDDSYSYDDQEGEKGKVGKEKEGAPSTLFES